MIDPNELRRGNLVKQGGIYIVTGIGEDVCFGRHLERGIETALDLNLMQPIPLTPEILHGCGFERCELMFTGGNGWRYKLGVHLQLSECLTYHNPHYNSKIPHLHTLQNLFFALTQTELTVKL